MAAMHEWQTIRTSLRTLEWLSADAPVHIVESYGNWGNLLWEYLRAPFRGLSWWRAWLKMHRHGKLQWRGVDVWPLIARHITETPLTDWPKNRYYRDCVRRSCATLGATAICIPIFELVEGRAAVAGAREAGLRVVGLQHGPNGQAHRWRFDRPLGRMVAEGAPYAPDLVAVEGAAVAAGLTQAGWPAERLAVVGALRIEETPLAFDPSRASRSILVLGEMHDPELTFRVALRMIEALPEWTIVLRPHPATLAAVGPIIAASLARDPERFQASKGGSLEDELASLRPGIIIAGVTGAAVAAARQGWPVVVAMSNWLPNFNPLMLAQGAAPLGGRAFSTSAIVDLSRTPEARRTYSEQCVRAGHAVLAATGRDAIAALIRVWPGNLG